MFLHLICCVFPLIFLTLTANGNDFLDNISLQRIVSCRRKIGSVRLQNCTEGSIKTWNLEKGNSVQLILNRESVCCAQWQSHDCRLGLAQDLCDRKEYEVMSYRMEKIRVMNQRTICGDYKYHEYNCVAPVGTT